MKGKRETLVRSEDGYGAVLEDVVRWVEAARSATARSVNAIMTATYWTIGRRIVEQEQKGAARADYGEELVVRLSRDLKSRFGRGFGRANLFQMKAASSRERRCPSSRDIRLWCSSDKGGEASADAVLTGRQRPRTVDGHHRACRRVRLGRLLRRRRHRHAGQDQRFRPPRQEDFRDRRDAHSGCRGPFRRCPDTHHGLHDIRREIAKLSPTSNN